MIDTVRLQWPEARLGPGYLEFLADNYPMAKRTTAAYAPDRPWEGVMFKDDVLGSIGTKCSKQGDYFWVERSIPKFLDGNRAGNCRQLTLEEAREGVALLVDSVIGLLGDYLPPSPHKVVQCNRVDFYYQRQMPAAEVFTHIARCAKTRRGNKVAVHLEGVEIHQSREIHARWYDKGLEAGRGFEQFIGTVRHEEQLRSSVAKRLLDMKTLRIDPVAVREQMNKRFAGWPVEVECFGYEQLLEAHKYHGGLAVALCEVPQLEEAYRRFLSRDMFYSVKKITLEARRRKSTLDLRVPDNAWQETRVV